MSEINLEELSKPKTTRPELEEVAVSLGLVDAKAYANKPAVLEAITKVHGGADAAEVNAEFKPADVENAGSDANDPATTPPDVQTSDESDDDAEDDDEADDDDESPSQPAKPAKKERYARNRNQGHPTKFDEQGRPLYRA